MNLNLFYSDLDCFTKNLFKILSILSWYLNKSSIPLTNYLRNKIILLHDFNCTLFYIYLCIQLNTRIISREHYSIHMNTTEESKMAMMNRVQSDSHDEGSETEPSKPSSYTKSSNLSIEELNKEQGRRFLDD